MSKRTVLVADKIDQKGLEILERAATVVVKTGLSESDIVGCIGPFDALVVRSATKVTAAVIGAGRNLCVVARAGVGVDNVDVKAATEAGIPVVMSPSGNTVAAAEHTVGMMMSLCRHIPMASASLHSGAWPLRSSREEFTGVQLMGKTLGIIGLGHVGQHVAEIAGRGLGMKLMGFDPFLPRERAAQLGVAIVPLEQLLEAADVVTLHVPLVQATKGLIGRRQLARMKRTAALVNCSRGGVVDEGALAAALSSGAIAGAALDVFENEPLSKDSPLLGISGHSLVLTPHLGAMTAEAQENVAIDVAEQVVEILQGSLPRSAVNLSVRGTDVRRAAPWLVLAEALGEAIVQVFDSNRHISSVQVTVRGKSVSRDVDSALAVAAVLKGVLSASLQDDSRFSHVNSRAVCERRGIKITESKNTSSTAVPGVIEVSATSSNGDTSAESHTLAGTTELSGASFPWLTSVDGFCLQVPFSRRMVVVHHSDVPGIVGSVGSALGKHNVNISFMAVGRIGVAGGPAVMVMGVDNSIPDGIAAQPKQLLPGIRSIRYCQVNAIADFAVQHRSLDPKL